MRTSCIYYWDNGVGVKVDASLIKECLDAEFDCSLFDFSISQNDNNNYFDYTPEVQYDIGIFIQNFQPNLLTRNKINVFIVNEEWLTCKEASSLSDFDYVIVKNKFAKKLLEGLHSNINVLYFWSRDLYDSHYNKYKNNNIIHFAGKSIQKNTECLLNNTNVHIFDSTGRYKDVRTEFYYTEYISDTKLSRVFNTSDTHICPSLYEAHGHYMFEGMLCDKKVIASKIPVWEEQIDPDYLIFLETKPGIIINEEYEFLNSNNDSESTKFPFRRGFIVDSSDLEDKIASKNYKKPRKYLTNLFNTNKNNFLEFFKNI